MALGCGGYMSELTRTRSGRFCIEESYTLEQIEEMLSCGDNSFFVPVGEAVPEYKKIVVAEKNAKKIRNGIKISVEGLNLGEIYRVFDEKDELLVIARQDDDCLCVLKTFYDGGVSQKQ
jgi:tRNA pseudouridine55 synthase